MDKPVIFYRVNNQVDPVSGAPMYVPQIVERGERVTLDEIVRRAIDRGLIAGLKVSAAKSIADAIARQMYEEFTNGHAVRFGEYFSCRLYLRGQSDANGTLSDRNRIIVRFFNGTAFRLDRSMFTFSNVEGGDIPFVDFAISDTNDATRNKLKPGYGIMFNGGNLFQENDTAARVAFHALDEHGEPASAPSFTLSDWASKGPALLACGWVGNIANADSWWLVPSRSPDGARWYTGPGRRIEVVQG